MVESGANQCLTQHPTLRFGRPGWRGKCIGGPLVEKALEMYHREISINWFGVPGEAVNCVLWGYKTYVFKIPGMTWYLKPMIGVRVTTVGEASQGILSVKATP